MTQRTLQNSKRTKAHIAPRLGRPSVSGLSVKVLGRTEYGRCHQRFLERGDDARIRVDRAAMAIGEVFPDLYPKAKLLALQLGRHLAVIRRALSS